MNQDDNPKSTQASTHRANRVSVSLADRLDPAIGEATAGVGALLTEMVRRTLRSGVQKIDEEMEDFVEEKVDACVSDRMPSIETRAIKVAEETAQVTAYKECETLETKTKTETERLAAEIEQAERRANDAVTRNIAELEERAKGTAATYREQIKALQQRVGELESLLEQERTERNQAITDTNQALTNLETLVRQHVESLNAADAEEKNARQIAEAGIVEQIRQSATTFEQQLTQSAATLEEQLRQSAAALSHQLKKVGVDLDQQRKTGEDRHRKFEQFGRQHDEQYEYLKHVCDVYEERLAELERPRGLKALWRKIRPPKEAKPEDETSA